MNGFNDYGVFRHPTKVVGITCSKWAEKEALRLYCTHAGQARFHKPS